ncbi:MAG: YwaF family protein [Bacilli bacterium]|nr:YwaF family protein [Bacilli bacterium]
MNLFEKILYWLQGEMNTPVAFGWFHWLWIIVSFIIILILYKKRKKHNEKQLKIVLCTYGVVSLILEVLKQLIWSFNYDTITNLVIWDYQWYAFPFQLCTTPIYVSITCLFLKKGKIRDSLLSYISYITILGSIATMIIPDSCFTSDILVNIHTMWLHLGSFVISVYLLLSGEVSINIKSFKKAIIIFLCFVVTAISINIIIYNIGILNGETFNMFYISPYFTPTLPIFDIIWQYVPYIVYLIIYIWALIIGGFIILNISSLIKKTKNSTVFYNLINFFKS